MSKNKVEIWLSGYNTKFERAIPKKIFEAEAFDRDDAVAQYLKKYPGMAADMVKDKNIWRYGSVNLFFR